MLQGQRLIALRYARSLFSLLDNNQQKVCSKGFSRLLELFELKQSCVVLNSSVMPASVKKELVEYSLKGTDKYDLLRRFVYMLIDAKRLSLLPLIVSCFNDLILESQNEAKAKVVVARALSSQQAESLEKGLEETFKKKLLVEYVEEPTILGGFVVYVNNYFLDCSLKNKITKLMVKL